MVFFLKSFLISHLSLFDFQIGGIRVQRSLTDRLGNKLFLVSFIDTLRQIAGCRKSLQLSDVGIGIELQKRLTGFTLFPDLQFTFAQYGHFAAISTPRAALKLPTAEICGCHSS